jgi:signal-transduction protein with cAMP-binding, CBS, and nucleotidyltransferase domain
MLSITSEELFKFFQKHAICESLTKPDIERLMNYLQEKEYADGEIIFDAGVVGDALGIIKKGKVEFSMPEDSDNAIGKQATGSLVGEMSFFDKKPRGLVMKACKKGTSMWILTRPMYDRLKVQEPYIAVNILENAIVSLDHLVRDMSDDISALGNYVHGYGKH